MTENVTQTVPVSREEVRLEREPITDKNGGEARSGADISEEEHEVVLNEERPVVEKEAVPVERVRLDNERVTDQERSPDRPQGAGRHRRRRRPSEPSIRPLKPAARRGRSVDERPQQRLRPRLWLLLRLRRRACL